MTQTKRRSIIRPEVIEAKIGLQGEVIMIRPLSFTFICLFFVAALLSVLLFLGLSDFTKTTRVKGILKSPGGITKVMPRQAGVIEKLYVDEGQRVVKGQPLYQVRTDQTGVSGSVSKQVGESLQQSLHLVEQKIEFQESLNHLELKEIDRNIAQFQRDAQHLVEELELEQEYQEILGRELSEIESLYKKKQITKVEYNGKYAQFIEKRIAVKGLKKERQDLLNHAENERLKRKNIEVRGRSLILEYQQKIADLKRQIASTGAQEAYVITAPHDGIVSNIYYRDGHFAEVGSALMNVLPEASDLVAEIYIPTSAIGLIDEGQMINMRYHAFPYQKFGLFEGRIEGISKTLIEPQQAEASNLVDSPVYRAQVRLVRQTIQAHGKLVSLQPGMTLDADVLGETRSLLSWLFDPFTEKMQGR